MWRQAIAAVMDWRRGFKFCLGSIGSSCLHLATQPETKPSARQENNFLFGSQPNTGGPRSSVIMYRSSFGRFPLNAPANVENEFKLVVGYAIGHRICHGFEFGWRVYP
jgi:hypothetical protein